MALKLAILPTLFLPAELPALIATVNVGAGETVTINNSPTLNAAVRMTTNTATQGAGGIASTLNVTGGSLTLLGNIISGSITAGGTGTNTSTVTLSGGLLNLTGNSIGTVAAPITTLNFQAGTLENVGAINGSGSVTGVAKTTAGTLILAGTNTWTGDTSATNGVLQVGPGSLEAIPFGPGAGNVVLNGGSTAGVLDINGSIVNINGLTGTAGTLLGQVVNNGATAATLIVGNANATATFAGSIVNNNNAGNVGPGILSLAKTGSGTEFLSGANTYTGATSVFGGTLQVGNGASGSINGASAVSVASGATLGVNLASNGTLSNTISSAGTVNANGSNSNTISGSISGVGNFVQSGSGTTTLSNTNGYTGTTTVLAGTLVVSGSISGTASVTVGDGTNPATLAGTGTITTATTGAVTVASAATLAPGLSTNGMSINAPVSGTSSLNLNTGSTLQLTIANSQSGTSGAPLAADYSKLTLGTGVSATLGGVLATTEVGTINRGDLFTIILSGSTIPTQFSNTGTQIGATTYLIASATTGYGYEINYAYDGALNNSGTGAPTGSNVDLGAFAADTGGTNVAILAVPEPNSFGMLVASLGMALGLQRFRRRRSG